MKAKHLIEALSTLDPEMDISINIKQSNKAFGVIKLPIEYGSEPNSTDETYKRQCYLNQWINDRFITVHLPDGVFITDRRKK